MDLQAIAKFVVMAGLALVLVGGLLWVGSKAGLGSLPGDITWKARGGTVYIPIATSILLSVLLTIVLNLLWRWFGR